MEIKERAFAGTLESSDIMITVKPEDSGIKIDIESDVEQQYGDNIKNVIKRILDNLEVSNAYIKANDKGALDYAIRARTETALIRASK